jgi:hypothetical protein
MDNFWQPLATFDRSVKIWDTDTLQLLQTCISLIHRFVLIFPRMVN